MSGKIELKKRKGKTKDNRYKNYYEWYIHVKGERGKEANLSPLFSEISQLWVDVFIHEFKNDIVRDRKPEFKKRCKQVVRYINKALSECQKLTIDDISPDYYENNAVNDALHEKRSKENIKKRLEELKEVAEETKIPRLKHKYVKKCSNCGRKTTITKLG